jgi:uncharacterized membrane-anchored protein
VCLATTVFFYLLLCSQIAVAGGGCGASVTDAAAKTAQKPETPTTYWESVLSGMSMPPAIGDLLAQRNGMSISFSIYLYYIYTMTFLF